MYYYSRCFCRECLKMDLSDRYKYDNCKAYCTAWRKYYDINDKACERYFEYDENRRQSSNDCYLTTIVCHVLGYPDNCEYLLTLRKFRDEYMLNNKECLSILYEYDVVGPILSNYIIFDRNKKSVSKSLFNNYIIKVVDLIKLKNYNDAIKLYIEMVKNLEVFYSIDIEFTKPINKKEVTGKGYLKKLNN